MDLQLSTRDLGAAAIVGVKGEIDNFTAPQLRSALGDALAGDTARLVVDLGETTFLDSSALGALVGAAKDATHAGTELVIVCPRAHLRRLFEMSRLTEVLPLFDSVDAALA